MRLLVFVFCSFFLSMTPLAQTPDPSTITPFFRTEVDTMTMDG